jgi:hypothetical protein
LRRGVACARLHYTFPLQLFRPFLNIDALRASHFCIAVSTTPGSTSLPSLIAPTTFEPAISRLLERRITSQPSHFVVHYLPPHIHCVGGAIPRSVIDHITVELLTACCTGPQPNRLVEVWITYPAILCFLPPGKTFNCTAYRRANGTHRQRWEDFNFGTRRRSWIVALPRKFAIPYVSS